MPPPVLLCSPKVKMEKEEDEDEAQMQWCAGGNRFGNTVGENCHLQVDVSSLAL